MVRGIVRTGRPRMGPVRRCSPRPVAWSWSAANHSASSAGNPAPKDRGTAHGVVEETAPGHRLGTDDRIPAARSRIRGCVTVGRVIRYSVRWCDMWSQGEVSKCPPDTPTSYSPKPRARRRPSTKPYDSAVANRPTGAGAISVASSPRQASTSHTSVRRENATARRHFARSWRVPAAWPRSSVVWGSVLWVAIRPISADASPGSASTRRTSRPAHRSAPGNWSVTA